MYFVDIYHLSAFCAASVFIAIIIIFTASQLWKKYKNRKNAPIVDVKYFDECCWYVYEKLNHSLKKICIVLDIKRQFIDEKHQNQNTRTVFYKYDQKTQWNQRLHVSKNEV